MTAAGAPGSRNPIRAALVAALLGASLCAGTVAAAPPSFAEVRAAHAVSDVTLLDRHGVPIQTVRVDKSVRRLPWVPLEQISPALLQAIVLSEDRRFYEHSGVDWGAVAASAWANLWNHKTRGASTLTMQLAGLIADDLARPAGGRSVAQKLEQALIATRLDASWKKSEILEAYLNSLAFRGEIVGIAALSQTLFGKYPSGLDTQESALTAALLRGPNARPQVVAQRACGVLQVQQLGCAGVVALTESALARTGRMPLGEQLAPHFARQVLARAAAADAIAAADAVQDDADVHADATMRSAFGSDGRITTTLDARLQRLAIASLRRQLTELAGRSIEDGAVVVLDNASGEVLAWVGSSGDLSAAAAVDGVLARRQPGSTLKPFVYELAFEQRLITPASLIDDTPAQIPTASGLYLPRNYDHAFKGWVSARSALGSSLNVPAVRVGMLLGPDALFERLNAFGFALPESGGYYGQSLALGSAEVTLLTLTNAYRALANGGVHGRVSLRPTPIPMSSVRLASSAATSARRSGGAATHPVSSGNDPLRVADAAAVFLVTDILADNAARARTFGLASLLATRGFAAAKTGTSTDMRDNWCVGYTERYTVGVWVGNASGEAMHGVSGISGAAPVWHELVQQLHRQRVSQPPPPPPGVVRTQITFEGGNEPARDEFFLAGTEQRLQRASSQLERTPRFGIANPRDGSIFAIDPDMPPDAQRITFEGERGVWVLDGQHLGHAERWSWAPWPGRHRLSLLDSNGRPLQSVTFEVRGASARSAAPAATAGRERGANADTQRR